MASIQARASATIIVARRRLSAFCVVVGLLALGSAIAAQIYAHLSPCPLCLWERWPYRGLIAFGVIGVTLPRSFGRVAIGFAILTSLCGLCLALTHVGVEHHLWKSPLPKCGGLPLQPGQPLPEHPAPPCDAPAYLWPRLPVSMAVMNALCELATAAILLYFFSRTKRKVAPHAKRDAKPGIAPVEKPAGGSDSEAASGTDDPGRSRG